MLPPVLAGVLQWVGSAGYRASRRAAPQIRRVLMQVKYSVRREVLQQPWDQEHEKTDRH